VTGETHSAIRVIPAMEAELATKAWTVGDILGLLLENQHF
jgi:hypothetical protein